MHRARTRRFASSLAVALVTAVVILPMLSGVASAGTSSWAANCGLNLRAKPTTTSTIRKVISKDTVVAVAGKVDGGWWKADCRTYVSGSSWYKIVAVNGRSVSSLLGISAVYAASGLFRSYSTGNAEGVDVSNWQGKIDWARVKGAGKRFAIAKATEGTTWTDASYARNRSYAIANGVRFGAYHFARPGTNRGDAAAEADHFIAQMNLRRGMLIPTLDLEVSGGLGPSALQAWTKAFVTRIYNRLGVKPMIYANASFWRTNMGDTTWFAVNGYRLWLAQWKVSSPTSPASNWASRSWSFWQYSSCGSVAGISGCVDLDRMRGADFAKFDY